MINRLLRGSKGKINYNMEGFNLGEPCYCYTHQCCHRDGCKVTSGTCGYAAAIYILRPLLENADL